MGQLNIKDEVVIAGAKALAARLGTSVTGALRHAVQTGQAQTETDREARIERLVQLGLHCAENLTGPPLTSEDANTWLYDPHTGLPR